MHLKKQTAQNKITLVQLCLKALGHYTSLQPILFEVLFIMPDVIHIQMVHSQGPMLVGSIYD